MTKNPIPVSAFSVAILIVSVVLLTKEWLIANPIDQGWQPYQPLFVGMVMMMFFGSLYGIWKSIKQN